MPIPTNEKALERFDAVWGNGTRYRELDAATETRLAAKTPETFVELLKRDGFCGYRGGALWMCDPDDWAPVARAWLPHSPGAAVIARSSFGRVYVWDGTIVWSVAATESIVQKFYDNGLYFFAGSLWMLGQFDGEQMEQQTREAAAAHGPLAWDEMYAYVPALALGGSPSTTKVERVKAREHLVMLAQLAPIQVIQRR